MRFVIAFGTLALIACDPSVRAPGEGGGVSDGGSAEAGGAGEGAGGGGAGFSVWPGQVFSETTCQEEGPLLFIEIWPTAADECVADPSVIDLIVIGIQGWDFSSGIFVLGEKTPHGTASAIDGGLGIPPVGSITLAPFDEIPGVLLWDVDGETGSTDLSLCHHPLPEPCATPL